MRDGFNSAVRYVKNNFMDGDRQDAIDLVLGKHRVETTEGATSPCPLRDTRDPRLLLLPFAIFFSLLMVGGATGGIVQALLLVHNVDDVVVAAALGTQYSALFALATRGHGDGE